MMMQIKIPLQNVRLLIRIICSTNPNVPRLIEKYILTNEINTSTNINKQYNGLVLGSTPVIIGYEKVKMIESVPRLWNFNLYKFCKITRIRWKNNVYRGEFLAKSHVTMENICANSNNRSSKDSMVVR